MLTDRSLTCGLAASLFIVALSAAGCAADDAASAANATTSSDRVTSDLQAAEPTPTLTPHIRSRLLAATLARLATRTATVAAARAFRVDLRDRRAATLAAIIGTDVSAGLASVPADARRHYDEMITEIIARGDLVERDGQPVVGTPINVVLATYAVHVFDLYAGPEPETESMLPPNHPCYPQEQAFIAADAARAAAHTAWRACRDRQPAPGLGDPGSDQDLGNGSNETSASHCSAEWTAYTAALASALAAGEALERCKAANP